MCGCLEFLNVMFRGAEHLIELQANATFPGLLCPESQAKSGREK
jgi:hypothetical protein